MGWGGPGFGCPAGNFSEQKVCVWGKALVVRDRGRRVGGEQGARFAGRRRAAFGIRWGFAAAGAGQTENRLQTLGSGRVKKKGRRSTSAFSLPSTCFEGRQTTSERRRGGRRNAQPDEVRGRTTDQKEKRQAAGGQALHDFTPGKPHVIVIQILCSVITITSPTIHPLRTRYTALVRRPERSGGALSRCSNPAKSSNSTHLFQLPAQSKFSSSHTQTVPYFPLANESQPRPK